MKPIGYEILYHVIEWHKEGSSHHAQVEDYGFHYKDSLSDVLNDVLEHLPNEDYVAITKHVFYDSLPETVKEEETR